VAHSKPEQLQFKIVGGKMSRNFTEIIERIYNLLKECPDPDKKDTTEEGWSIREILGHLVDSVSNNHQRLARYQAGGNLDFPAYDQIQFVQRAHYQTFDFPTLLSLWLNYNKLLLHMIDHLPPEDLQSTLIIGDRPTITIEALVEDYFAHMGIHEEQMKRIINA
jgi:hypothetical protein